MVLAMQGAFSGVGSNVGRVSGPGSHSGNT